MEKFNLDSYMLDGLIENAKRGDLHARNALMRECELYRAKRKRPPQKIRDALQAFKLKNARRGPKSSPIFEDYLIFSYIRGAMSLGMQWEELYKKNGKIEDSYKNSSLAKTIRRYIDTSALEKIYRAHKNTYKEYLSHLVD